VIVGWPVPPRGGVLVEDYEAINRARSEYKRQLLLRNSLPVNVVLQEAADDA